MRIGVHATHMFIINSIWVWGGYRTLRLKFDQMNIKDCFSNLCAWSETHLSRVDNGPWWLKEAQPLVGTPTWTRGSDNYFRPWEKSRVVFVHLFLSWVLLASVIFLCAWDTVRIFARLGFFLVWYTSWVTFLQILRAPLLVCSC